MKPSYMNITTASQDLFFLVLYPRLFNTYTTLFSNYISGYKCSHVYHNQTFTFAYIASKCAAFYTQIKHSQAGYNLMFLGISKSLLRYVTSHLISLTSAIF
jgi:hypothetical protein